MDKEKIPKNSKELVKMIPKQYKKFKEICNELEKHYTEEEIDIIINDAIRSSLAVCKVRAREKLDDKKNRT